MRTSAASHPDPGLVAPPNVVDATPGGRGLQGPYAPVIVFDRVFQLDRPTCSTTDNDSCRGHSSARLTDMCTAMKALGVVLQTVSPILPIGLRHQ